MKEGVKFRGTIEVIEGFAMHYIGVPPPIVKKLGGKFRARLICTLQGSHTFPIGLGAMGGGIGFITVAAKRLKELGLKRGDRASVELKLDTSKYGMPLPPELKELLKQDPEFAKRFAGLKPGMQRSVLHHVGSAKNEERRLERAFAAAENLKGLLVGSETVPALLGRKRKADSERW
jgi:hypothetical protein